MAGRLDFVGLGSHCDLSVCSKGKTSHNCCLLLFKRLLRVIFYQCEIASNYLNFPLGAIVPLLVLSVQLLYSRVSDDVQI